VRKNIRKNEEEKDEESFVRQQFSNLFHDHFKITEAFTDQLTDFSVCCLTIVVRCAIDVEVFQNI
jgi:hypothetical protein